MIVWLLTTCNVIVPCSTAAFVCVVHVNKAQSLSYLVVHAMLFGRKHESAVDG